MVSTRYKPKHRHTKIDRGKLCGVPRSGEYTRAIEKCDNRALFLGSSLEPAPGIPLGAPPKRVIPGSVRDLNGTALLLAVFQPPSHGEMAPRRHPMVKAYPLKVATSTLAR